MITFLKRNQTDITDTHITPHLTTVANEKKICPIQ